MRTRSRAAMRRAPTTSREVRRRGRDGETGEGERESRSAFFLLTTRSSIRPARKTTVKREKGLQTVEWLIAVHEARSPPRELRSGFGTMAQAKNEACRGTASLGLAAADHSAARSPPRTRTQSQARAVVARAHPTDAREEQERRAARRSPGSSRYLLSRRDFEHVDRRVGSHLGVHLGGASLEPVDRRGETFSRSSHRSSPDASRRLRARHGHGG